MKVLIVDDAAFMRITLKGILESLGHEVISEADNGKKAIDKYNALMLQGQKPDVVTMDITMPEVDGIQGLKGIKKLDENAAVIMVSAMGQANMVKEAVRAGAKDFIVKPFKQEKLKQTLDNISRAFI